MAAERYFRKRTCRVEMESWNCRRLSVKLIVLCLLVQFCTVECFVVENAKNVPEDGEKKVTTGPVVLIGDIGISQNRSGDSVHGNCSHGDEEGDDKIEQMLMDIFVDEDDDKSDDEIQDDEEDDNVHEEKYREDPHDDEEDESTFEEILSDSIASHEETHKITKRDADELVRTARKNTPRPKVSRQSTSKKRPNQKVSTRGHKSKSKSKKSNVSKYNEYMDVVLKRMNTMIKSKHMDPLMVNLFSGNGGQAGKGGKKPVKKVGGDKKKKKSGGNKTVGNKSPGKKRKGANKARIEDDDELEGRSVSSDSDSSGTVELDNEHERVHNVNGVFIRRVGVVTESGEEEDDAGEEDEFGERAFRKIRALIVNGSMKRSAGSGASNETKVSSAAPSTTAATEATTKASEAPKKSSEETRGFDKKPVESSEESPRKKNPGKNSGKKKPEKQASKKKPAKRSRATRGVLKGLSSLKRNGDVDVVKQNDNVRIVRGRFNLGPVTLEIVPKNGKGKEEGRGKKGKKPKTEPQEQEQPKVTAVARELKGIIEVRLKKNSPTTIKRLRVFPPSSVKIKPSSKKPTKASVPRYNRVTPVATHRLRQIASAVVRQADVRRKVSGLEGGKKVKS